MLKWKKTKPLALILAAVLCLGVFASCALERQVPTEDETEVDDFPMGTENEADIPVRAAFPITANYSTAERQYDHVYETDETEYVTYMDISIHEDIKDVSFGLLNWDGADLYMEKTLYTAPIMEEHDVFLAAVVFYGDMTTYGITFTDEAGEERSFTFVINGMDGSLECLETERILPMTEES